MTVDQVRQYMAHYFVNKEPRLIEPFVAVRMAVGRGPEFERWVQSSAAAYDMLLNEPAVDFIASLPTPTLFVCGLSDRTYVGAKYAATKDQGAKGNIAEMAKGFAAGCPTPVSWVCPTRATYRIWNHRPRSVRPCSNFCVERLVDPLPRPTPTSTGMGTSGRRFGSGRVGVARVHDRLAFLEVYRPRADWRSPRCQHRIRDIGLGHTLRRVSGRCTPAGRRSLRLARSASLSRAR
jgi:hypothetical protein